MVADGQDTTQLVVPVDNGQVLDWKVMLTHVMHKQLI